MRFLILVAFIVALCILFRGKGSDGGKNNDVVKSIPSNPDRDED